MQFSQAELKQISQEASTMSERLNTRLIIKSQSKESNTLVNERLERWCQIVAEGDWELFQKRLSWDSLDFSEVCHLFDSVSTSDEQQIPIWAETLHEYLKASAHLSIFKGANSERSYLLDTKESLPFEEILLPFTYVARSKVRSLVGSHYELLTEPAHYGFEQTLLRWLVNACQPSMEVEFWVFRASRQSTLVSRLQKFTDTPSHPYYQEFIKSLLEGGMLTFLKEYPVLARLLATTTDLWVDATVEFISRLKSDLSEIKRTFQAGIELGQIIAVQSGLSDRHHNNRYVTAVTFASGLKLVYKPRDLGIEQAYVKLLDWLNNHNICLPFKLLKILNRSTYGWVEFVEALCCKNKEESREYYKRSGMLLCLVYMLDSTDLHHDNIIACGEHPVLIDLETLMHPWVREMEQSKNNTKEVKSLASQQLWHSVLRTALLPQWKIGKKGQAYDDSGLGGTGTINTSNQQQEGNESKRDNVPVLDKIKLELQDYHTEIVNGFEQMYRFLMTNRQELLAIDSPLTALANQSVRFVFRNTSTYASTLQLSLNPKFLRDGVERSIQLDILSRPMLVWDTKPLCWPLLQVEKQALEQMDIPLFTARSDSDALTVSPNQTIDKYFTEPSFNLVVTRLNQLNEQDLEEQISCIKGSLYSRTTENAHDLSWSENQTFAINTVLPLTQGELLLQAIILAADLQKKAIRSANSSATWLAPQYMPETNRFQFQPMGHSLFDGCYGVAFFLAALEKVSTRTTFHELALGSLQSLRQDLWQLVSTHFSETKNIIGGAVGSGAMIYVLSHVSQFFHEPTLPDDAKQVASFITPDLIVSIQEFDIISGAAGAILGLLTLHNISADPEVLQKAILCGNHLLNNRITSESGCRAWATSDGKLLTGFSHGAAGIAYALLRLYKASGEIAFLEAAEEAIAYERSVFIPEQENWPDFRQSFPKDKPVCMCSWCHGATGIGLARLGGLDILDTPEIRQDIEAAINTTKQQKLTGIDHLCCGNMGRVEFLLTASRKLSRPDLLEDAMQIASQVVARANQKGHFGYGPILTFHPGFFQGASGIGYQLLRLAYPDQLPSVLLWE
jgi:type 2 lantibiotic biosynthesis protein LanM